MSRKRFFKNLSVQLVGDDDIPVEESVVKKSDFLQFAIKLNLDHIIVPASEDMNTEKLGHLWDGVLPDDGQYEFEIATVLPYYLPHFDNSPEYVFTIDGSEFVVSSRMIRCFFSTASECDAESSLQYYLVNRGALASLRENASFTHMHPVPMKTFITKRLVVEAATAEEAVQKNFFAWTSGFVSEISKFLESVRVASPENSKHLLPQSSTPLLSVFWIHVRGKEGMTGTGQFAGDLSSAAFRSLSNLDKSATKRVQAILNDSKAVAVHDSALALASTYLHYGYYGLALVQVSVACESALARVYREFLLSRGVSKKKYEESERDITYSQLLNLHLAAALDLSKLTGHQEIIRCLNWARRSRNDVVHTGSSKKEILPEHVEKAIDSASRLIEFVKTAFD